VGKICDFWPISRCISVTVRDRVYRVLLTTNRKSYTGSRLAPNSMTLNDLERQNKEFYGFFWRFQAATQAYIIHMVAPRNYRYAIQIENLVFVLRSLGRSPRNFASCSVTFYNAGPKIWGAAPPKKKIGGAKNMLILARFRTPFPL